MAGQQIYVLFSVLWLYKSPQVMEIMFFLFRLFNIFERPILLKNKTKQSNNFCIVQSFQLLSQKRKMMLSLID